MAGKQPACAGEAPENRRPCHGQASGTAPLPVAHATAPRATIDPNLTMRGPHTCKRSGPPSSHSQDLDEILHGKVDGPKDLFKVRGHCHRRRFASLLAWPANGVSLCAAPLAGSSCAQTVQPGGCSCCQRPQSEQPPPLALLPAASGHGLAGPPNECSRWLAGVLRAMCADWGRGAKAASAQVGSAKRGHRAVE